MNPGHEQTHYHHHFRCKSHNHFQAFFRALTCKIFSLIPVAGNVFVIAAIILERNLQNVANYLVASLAVADLFVACLVMPLGAVYEVNTTRSQIPGLCTVRIRSICIVTVTVTTEQFLAK